MSVSSAASSVCVGGGLARFSRPVAVIVRVEQRTYSSPEMLLSRVSTRGRISWVSPPGSLQVLSADV